MLNLISHLKKSGLKKILLLETLPSVEILPCSITDFSSIVNIADILADIRKKYFTVGSVFLWNSKHKQFKKKFLWQILCFAIAMISTPHITRTAECSVF